MILNMIKFPKFTEEFSIMGSTLFEKPEKRSL